MFASVLFVVIALLASVGAVASGVAVARDGYRRVPASLVRAHRA